MNARRGLTLPEVIIAMGLFVIAMSLVMEGMVASRDLHSHEASQDEVNLDATRITAEIAQDMAVSGWYLPPLVGSLPRDYAGDRATEYYPFVQLQDQGGGTHGRDTGVFAHTWRGPGMTQTDAWPRVPGNPADRTRDWDQTSATERGRYVGSFFARSQELIFLRQLVADDWESDPRRMQRPSLDFRGSIAKWRDSEQGHIDAEMKVLYPSGWVDGASGYTQRTPGVPYGLQLRAGQLQNLDGTLTFRRLWETQAAPDWKTLERDADGNLPDPPVYRQYLYAVIPSPPSTNGMGRLVRAYSAPDPGGATGFEPGQVISRAAGRAMIIEKVLSDDVARVTFDTWRTDPALDVEDIRVRLYLMRRQRSNPDLIVSRVVETIVQMRAKAAEIDRRLDAAQTDIGAAGGDNGWRLDL